MPLNHCHRHRLYRRRQSRSDAGPMAIGRRRCLPSTVINLHFEFRMRVENQTQLDRQLVRRLRKTTPHIRALAAGGRQLSTIDPLIADHSQRLALAKSYGFFGGIVEPPVSAMIFAKWLNWLATTVHGLRFETKGNTGRWVQANGACSSDGKGRSVGFVTRLMAGKVRKLSEVDVTLVAQLFLLPSDIWRAREVVQLRHFLDRVAQGANIFADLAIDTLTSLAPDKPELRITASPGPPATNNRSHDQALVDTPIEVRCSIPGSFGPAQMLAFDRDKDGKVTLLSHGNLLAGDVWYQREIVVPRTDARLDGSGPVGWMAYDQPAESTITAIIASSRSLRFDRFPAFQDSLADWKAKRVNFPSVPNVTLVRLRESLLQLPQGQWCIRSTRLKVVGKSICCSTLAR